MFPRHIRSILAASILVAALTVAGTASDPINRDGTNWGQAVTHTVVAPR